jgi:betaine lipid synthase
MGNYLPVTEFFRTVYLVDLSPSLGEIAKARFQKLGWKNVKIVNQDVRYFRLEDHEGPYDERSKETYEDGNAGRVDLITMSYSLSMIPEYYPIIESMTSLLSIDGIISVVDFYAQNQLDYRNRNYIGGVLGRHCNWLNRTFWRLWFEFDRVHLDAARRDYLEF